MFVAARLSALLSAYLLFTLIFVPPQHQAHAEGRPVCSGDMICLDQGWTDEQRWWWYTTSQGSRLLPLSWMLALDSGPTPSGPPRWFLSRSDVERWGYLPGTAPDRDVYGLPLGFAIDEQPGPEADIMCDSFPESCRGGLMRRKWVGMTCATCHTNDIQFGGKRVRVEGTSTLADFQTFEEDLLGALESAFQDGAKFSRFARIVLKARNSAVSRRQLRSQLAEHIAWQRRLQTANQSATRYGHARLDAQGHIFNKVAASARLPLMVGRVPADAPASYPFIWNTSQQEKIQWNGIAENSGRVKINDLETDLGALIRNTSEVIGVFAHIEADKGKAALGYPSSIRIKELVDLERMLATLKSPRWPENVLGAIDWQKAERGKVLFDSTGCSGCHERLAWDDLTSKIKASMHPIALMQTDIGLACNTYFHRSSAGNFKDQEIYIGPFNNGAESQKPGDNVIKDQDFTRNMLVNTILGAIIRQKPKIDAATTTSDIPAPERAPEHVRGNALIDLPGDLNEHGQVNREKCLNVKDRLLAYKARPLNGIWATAPYLHNGSVPTLYDLLLPSAASIHEPDKTAPGMKTRPESFGVGNNTFDPRKVGFITDPALNPTIFHVRDEKTGKAIAGNLNSGHTFGTTLTDDERYDLVEYLKTL